MFMFISYLKRSEAWIADSCPSYESDSLSLLMVFGSYLPVYTFLAVVLLSNYDRTAYHVLLGTGMLGTSLMLWGLGAIIPQMRNDPTLCSNRTEARVCEEAAIIGFVAAYYFAYRFWKPRERGSKVISGTVFLLAYAVCGTYSQIYLKLFTTLEVFFGLSAGVACSLVMSLWIYNWFVPNMHHPLIQLGLRNMRIYRHGLCYDKHFSSNGVDVS